MSWQLTGRTQSRPHAGRYGIAVCVALMAASLGCGEQDMSCRTPDEGLTVRYVGQAYGYGTIHVGWNALTRSYIVKAHMLGPDSMAEILLEGEGTCERGVLRVRLGGGRDEASGLRVLGGGLLVMFEHDPMPSIAGFWDVRAVRDGRDDGPDGRRFRGMLEAVDPSEAGKSVGEAASGEGEATGSAAAHDEH